MVESRSRSMSMTMSNHRVSSYSTRECERLTSVYIWLTFAQSLHRLPPPLATLGSLITLRIPSTLRRRLYSRTSRLASLPTLSRDRPPFRHLVVIRRPTMTAQQVPRLPQPTRKTSLQQLSKNTMVDPFTGVLLPRTSCPPTTASRRLTVRNREQRGPTRGPARPLPRSLVAFLAAIRQWARSGAVYATAPPGK